MKKLALLFGLLLAFPAFAADNTVIVTPGTGVTMKSKDIGAGVQAMQPILSDASGNTLLTTLGADAVSNTLTGIPVYSRQLFYNGTTWDRWQGAVTVAGVATAANQTTINTSIGTTNTNLGAPGATVCATDTGSCSLNALFQRALQTLTTIGTNTGAAIPAGTAIIGSVKQTDGTTVVVTDPCQGSTKLYKPISITTATTTNVITGASAKKTYICHIFLTSAAADNVAIIEGTTGATCGSGTAALIGGTTAANGLNFAANGGVALGNGGYSLAATATNQNDVCLITSAATPLAGVITYAQQ